jgi:cation transport ATPase
MGTVPESPPGSTTGLTGKYRRIAVPVTAAACLLALTIVLKNILLMPADQLNRDIVLYIILYFGFIVSYPFFGKAKENLRAGSPAIWCGIILAATLAIIALYAV